jgi:hypothetical protein
MKENITLAALDSAQRSRQFYLSVDPDWPNDHVFLKTLFCFNSLKLHLLNTL